MSSGFITETEIVEARKQRQEEWEKVRQPDQPEELPEEPYDSRSLFERLKEQKDKKDLEFEETHKLKNLIRGLDDDEIDFLAYVDRTKMTAEKKTLTEDNKELEEFRQKVATLHEKSLDDKVQAELSIAKPKTLSNNGVKRPSQKSILSSGIVVKKRKISEGSGEDDKTTNAVKLTTITSHGENSPEEVETIKQSKSIQAIPSALTTIGILPGIGNYDSEESSSDCEEEIGKFDLCGRHIKKKECYSE